MGNLFGKKKVSRVTEHDKAVLVSNIRYPLILSFEKSVRFFF